MIPIIILSLVVLLLLRVPVAFAIAGAALLYFVSEPVPTNLLVQRIVSGILPFPLLAIPFFVLAGVLMARGGIAERILGLANSMIGHRRGGLAQVNVFNSLIMGGMSGSGNADAAVDAKVLVPIMTRSGYSKSFSTALSVATGVIAPIIPPGIGLIIYGYLTNVSIGRLFLAGVVPGMVLALALGITVSIISRRRNYVGSHDSRRPWREIATETRRAFWALMMPVLLVIGLRLGVFTPTELGAVAALYALLVSLIFYREIGIRDLPDVLRESAVASAVILLIIAAGNAFGWVITLERAPQQVIEGLTSVVTSPWVVLLLLNAALLAMGALIDATALLVILSPMIASIGVTLGIDPVHLGVVVVLNLTIGAITPPIGTIMYTACAITGTTVPEYSREILPFLIAVIGVLLLVTFVPALALLLPNASFG